MEKQIVMGCYWLGMVSAFLAVVLRSLNFFGLVPTTVVQDGHTLWYMTLFHGALLFLLIATATASYASSRGGKV